VALNGLLCAAVPLRNSSLTYQSELVPVFISLNINALIRLFRIYLYLCTMSVHHCHSHHALPPSILLRSFISGLNVGNLHRNWIHLSSHRLRLSFRLPSWIPDCVYWILHAYLLSS